MKDNTNSHVLYCRGVNVGGYLKMIDGTECKTCLAWRHGYDTAMEESGNDDWNDPAECANCGTLTHYRMCDKCLTMEATSNG